MAENDEVAGDANDETTEGGRTPKQERRNERRLRRKLARAVEDVAYGLRQSSSGYGTKGSAYGQRKEGEDSPGVKGKVKQMLEEELGDLFGDD